MLSSLLLSEKETNKNRRKPHQKNNYPPPPRPNNLVRNCSGYVFWSDRKCSESNGRSLIAFIASSGFWVKSSNIDESFISMISALQQMIKIQCLPFVLKFPRLTGFVSFHLSIQQTALHITVCFWSFDLSFGQSCRRFSFQISPFRVRCSTLPKLVQTLRAKQRSGF